ncbi:hypothetical protein [Piscinibacter sakaiensis]|uniref:Uncharacterized protein n=1 Tax=Piscinibacter sakaiensis TaxID=1547922 RepID=A0A0K8P043_PISS1|nr:hypothetical protein [Piscinibacter sakaiensis]GAP35545.1 hypothetical protein ISF6_1318 [Piscinibacter sakaiensis]
MDIGDPDDIPATRKRLPSLAELGAFDGPGAATPAPVRRPASAGTLATDTAPDAGRRASAEVDRSREAAGGSEPAAEALPGPAPAPALARAPLPASGPGAGPAPGPGPAPAAPDTGPAPTEPPAQPPGTAGVRELSPERLRQALAQADPDTRRKLLKLFAGSQAVQRVAGAAGAPPSLVMTRPRRPTAPGPATGPGPGRAAAPARASRFGELDVGERLRPPRGAEPVTPPPPATGEAAGPAPAPLRSTTEFVAAHVPVRPDAAFTPAGPGKPFGRPMAEPGAGLRGAGRAAAAAASDEPLLRIDEQTELLDALPTGGPSGRAARPGAAAAPPAAPGTDPAAEARRADMQSRLDAALQAEQAAQAEKARRAARAAAAAAPGSDEDRLQPAPPRAQFPTYDPERHGEDVHSVAARRKDGPVEGHFPAPRQPPREPPAPPERERSPRGTGGDAAAAPAFAPRYRHPDGREMSPEENLAEQALQAQRCEETLGTLARDGVNGLLLSPRDLDAAVAAGVLGAEAALTLWRTWSALRPVVHVIDDDPPEGTTPRGRAGDRSDEPGPSAADADDDPREDGGPGSVRDGGPQAGDGPAAPADTASAAPPAPPVAREPAGRPAGPARADPPVDPVAPPALAAAGAPAAAASAVASTAPPPATPTAPESGRAAAPEPLRSTSALAADPPGPRPPQVPAAGDLPSSLLDVSPAGTRRASLPAPPSPARRTGPRRWRGGLRTLFRLFVLYCVLSTSVQALTAAWLRWGHLWPGLGG